MYRKLTDLSHTSYEAKKQIRFVDYSTQQMIACKMPAQCYDGSCTLYMQWRSYTRAYQGTGPRKFVYALVKLLNSWAKNMILVTITAPKLLKIYGCIATIIAQCTSAQVSHQFQIRHCVHGLPIGRLGDVFHIPLCWIHQHLTTEPTNMFDGKGCLYFITVWLFELVAQQCIHRIFCV